MNRVSKVCLLLVLCGLVAASTFNASAQLVQLRVDAINPYEYLVTPPPAGTMPISTGLNVFPRGMRVYFVADTAGSGANVVSTFAWTITSVPGGSAVTTGSLYSATAKKTSFVADVEGDYTVQLVAGGRTLTKTVTASTFRGTTTGTDCGLCHAPGSPAKNAWNEWKTSKHATIFKRGLTGLLEVETSYDGLKRGAYSKNCVKCHTTGWDQTVNNGNFGYIAHLDNGAIQAWDTTWYKDPVNFAAQGEFFIRESTLTNWTNLTTSYAALEGVASIGCEQCHGPANLHASGQFAKIGKSFNSGVCDPCHTSSGKHSIGVRWGESKHAILAEGLHTAQPNCYPCHSGKAFVKWVANKSAPGYDTTTVGGQLSPTNDGNISINCTTCHDPHTLQLRTTTLDSLRNGYQPPLAVGGTGRLCMNCHNSRYSVKVRVTSNAPYYGFTNRFGPHENGQADLFVGSNAYQYGDATLTGLMTHGNLENGCVTCHMAKGLNASSPVQSYHAVNMIDTLGNPTLAGLTACRQCHGAAINAYEDVKAFADYDGDGTVEGFQHEVEGLLAKLKNRLPKDPLTGEPVTMLRDSLLVKGQQKVVQDLWNYYFINNDGSRGVHNPKYTVAILQKALGITFTGVKANGGPAPTSYALDQNYPNPFNPTTNISFSVPQQGQVKVEVYDVLGRLISTLVNTDLPVGNYTTTWNGKDANGASVATGMYIYRMQAGTFSTVKKMLMVK